MPNEHIEDKICLYYSSISMQSLIIENATRSNTFKDNVFSNVGVQCGAIHSLINHCKQIWLRFNRYFKLQLYDTIQQLAEASKYK